MRRLGFVPVGEQVDEEDGLKLVYELPALQLLPDEQTRDQPWTWPVRLPS